MLLRDITYVIVLEQGAIASIAALSIRNSFPDAALRLFTFGGKSRTHIARCLLNMTARAAKDRRSFIR